MSILRAVLVGGVVLAYAGLARAEASSPLPAPLRADQVVAFAKEHRSEIVASRAKASALAETPKVVSALPDPMVMVSVDHLPFSFMGVDATIAVQQYCPLSGVLGKTRLSAAAEANAALSDVKRVELDVELEAVVAYLMVAERERMAAVIDDQIGTAKQIVEATLARLETGSGSAAEVVRARLDVARLEGERKALDAETVGARSMLNAVLGRPATSAVPITSFAAPTGEPAPLPTLIATASEKRPELATLKFASEKAQADIDVMKAMYKPMAFVRLGVARTMEEGNGLMLMIGVTVPIWREKLAAGVSEAKSMSLMVDAETAAARKMIEGEVGSARGDVVAAKIRFETTRDRIVPIARQSVTLTLSQYATGGAQLVAVLDTLQMLRMAQMEQVVNEVRLGVAWARLGRAMGVIKIGST
ncbi:MAG: TolC family protein [Polyangiales bacterium]